MATPNRALSRQLNDAAIAAAQNGNNQLSQQKWVEAATADPTFSAPAFNLARYMLSKGARGADLLRVVEKYLDAAERNASNGDDYEDTQILQQLPALWSWLESRRNTIEI